MDNAVTAFPRAVEDADPDEVGSTALAEIDTAIALVARGLALRVRVAALPFAEVVAATGLARARAAHVGFTVEPEERIGVRTITVGPRD